MRKSHRKALIRVVEVAALALLLLDVALYFALVRPLANMVVTEQQRRNLSQRRVQEGRKRVARLEKFQVALPGADDQIKAFLHTYVPPRRRGFSRAARLVRQLTQLSGLQLSGVSYRLDSTRSDPLQRLGIEVRVEGPFPGLLNFAHALETASDFIVVRDFSFEPAEGSTITLRLGADLYLTP